MTTFEEIEKIVPSHGYRCFDISNEEERTVHLNNGFSFTINKPIALVIRDAGSTHRVVAENGRTYCYAVPEDGKSIISWKGKNDTALTF